MGRRKTTGDVERCGSELARQLDEVVVQSGDDLLAVRVTDGHGAHPSAYATKSRLVQIDEQRFFRSCSRCRRQRGEHGSMMPGATGQALASQR